MSALRIDARNTNNGRAPISPSGASSVMGSEAPSYAAGRPTKQAPLGLGSSAGRKHYAASETSALDDDNRSVTGSITSVRIQPKPRTPAPFADMSDVPTRQNLQGRPANVPPPRTPAPYAYAAPEPVAQRPPSEGGYSASTRS